MSLSVGGWVDESLFDVEWIVELTFISKLSLEDSCKCLEFLDSIDNFTT